MELERGRRWVFATAVDWPGWCRRARGDDAAAVEALTAYEGRYRAVVPTLPVGAGDRVEVVEVLSGGATTDFGAPEARGATDAEPLPAAERARLLEAYAQCWTAFDAVVASAPAGLRKGPRGGGRDRDAVADHVREAERSYGRAVGVRVPPRTPWPEQRALLLGGLRQMPEAGTTAKGWSVRYLVRRGAWHVLDHAWEIEDRSG